MKWHSLLCGFLLCGLVLVTPAQEIQVVGGRQRVDPKNAILLSALEAVHPQIQNKTNSRYVHRVSKIIKAYSQVVAGLKFYVTLELAQTQCLKATTINVESCNGIHTKKCEAEIWVQTWLNHNELLKFDCKSK